MDNMHFLQNAVLRNNTGRCITRKSKKNTETHFRHKSGSRQLEWINCHFGNMAFERSPCVSPLMEDEDSDDHDDEAVIKSKSKNNSPAAPG